jgi:RNA polymerase sigma factor (TIGR02999 family)
MTQPPEHTPPSLPAVTQLLGSAGRGDPIAATQLLPLLYEELRKLAGARLAREPGGGAHYTLQPTGLVHEAYMRLIGPANLRWESRGHFFGAAALAMRRILIERARLRGRLEPSPGEDFEVVAAGQEPGRLLDLDEALVKLEAHDKRKYDVVMMRYFAGLGVEETASALGISPATVKNDWSYARAWLQQKIGDDRGTRDVKAGGPA